MTTQGSDATTVKKAARYAVDVRSAQWHNKGDQLYPPKEHVAYLPSPRYISQYETFVLSVMPNSMAPWYDDPLSRHQFCYLNGGGGSGKTTRAIELLRLRPPHVHAHPSPGQRDADPGCQSTDLPQLLPMVWDPENQVDCGWPSSVTEKVQGTDQFGR